MAKLYLHCGYHKTGSSFLQVMFAQNRDYLKKNGIYFPYSKDDRNMLSGKISPGNGIELVKAIKEKNSKLLGLMFNNWINEAHSMNAQSILISSEGLFHVLAEPDNMDLFVNACEETGLNAIYGLLFFRDPVSHALSLFKHRGKSGKISNFRKWVKNDYETWRLTKSFLNIHKNYNVKWMFQKYSSDSKYMANITFQNWLNLKTPKIVSNDRVNISLTLSEIIAIREIKSFIPGEYLTKIHAELSNLSSNQKANDKSLKKYFNSVCYEELNIYSDVIQKVNELLPDQEKLIFENFEEVKPLDEESISLTLEQLQIFFNAFKDSGKIYYKMISSLKRFLKKIRQRVLKKRA